MRLLFFFNFYSLKGFTVGGSKVSYKKLKNLYNENEELQENNYLDSENKEGFNSRPSLKSSKLIMTANENKQPFIRKENDEKKRISDVLIKNEVNKVKSQINQLPNKIKIAKSLDDPENHTKIVGEEKEETKEKETPKKPDFDKGKVFQKGKQNLKLFDKQTEKEFN